MNAKKVIIPSTFLIVIGILMDYYQNYFDQFIRGSRNMEIYDGLMQAMVYFPVITIVMVLLAKVLKGQSFNYWWGFAKYGIPATLLLLFAVNFGVLHSPTQGSFGWGGLINSAVDIWAIILILTVFVIGSIIQIARGYFAK